MPFFFLGVLRVRQKITEIPFIIIKPYNFKFVNHIKGKNVEKKPKNKE